MVRASCLDISLRSVTGVAVDAKLHMLDKAVRQLLLAIVRESPDLRLSDHVRVEVRLDDNPFMHGGLLKPPPQPDRTPDQRIVARQAPTPLEGTRRIRVFTPDPEDA